MDLEQEIKYRITDPPASERYLGASYWADLGLTLGEIEEIVMHAKYYDLVDRSLAAEHIGVRIRTEGPETLLCVKYSDAETISADRSEQSSLYVRQEWEWPILGQDDQEAEAWTLLQGALDELPELVRNLLDGAKLELVYESRFTRLRADLFGEACVLELAVDEGDLFGRYETEHVHELEVELKNGELRDLLSVAEVLEDEADLEAQPLSKTVRLNRLSAADCVIVGAGAAGLMASWQYLELEPEARVFLLEASTRAAKKLSASGNGRGNITNNGLTAANYHQVQACENKSLIETQLATMSPEELRHNFYGMGLMSREEEDRIYPFSYQAKAVGDLLVRALDMHHGLSIVYQARVSKIKPLIARQRDTLYLVQTEDGQAFYTRRLIVTTGGQAAPKLGSDGSGYPLLRSLGHSVTALYPGLVQLEGRGLPKRLHGQRVHAELSIMANKLRIGSEFGEILLTDYGLSGIPVLNLSHLASAALMKGETVEAHLDLSYELAYGELTAFMDRRFRKYPNLVAKEFALGFLPDKLSSAICNLAGIDEEKPLRLLDEAQRERLEALCHQLVIRITGTKSYDFAQVTCGGVPCGEVDPLDLESNIHKGLYIAGELLDVHGDCGGFNLHMAFVTGMNAARAAATNAKEREDR